MIECIGILTSLFRGLPLARSTDVCLQLQPLAYSKCLSFCMPAHRFLLMRVSKREPPKGIALSKVLLALAGLARTQKAFKLARFAYSRLQVSPVAYLSV